MGKLCDEPCVWYMCDRVQAYVSIIIMCNLLCDVIIFTPSSPAQREELSPPITLCVEPARHLGHFQCAPMATIRMVGVLCGNVG